MILKRQAEISLYRKGFTLAEVLLTLGILGIIAVMLLPTMRKVTPDTNKLMFKKAYSNLENIIEGISNDETVYPPQNNWTYGSNSYTCTDNNSVTVQCGFHNVLTTANALYANNKFCTLLTQQINTTGTTFCPVNSTASGYGYFGTSDGIYWNVFNSIADSTTASNATPSSTATEFPLNSNYYTTKILIDVNGTKGPNCTLDTNGNTYAAFYNGTAAGSFNYSASCSNPDRFIISVRYDGKMLVGCSKDEAAVCTTITDQNAINMLLTPSQNVR